MKKWMRLTDACFLTCDMSKFLQKQWYLGLHLMGPNSIHMAIKTHSIRKLHQCMAAIRTLPPRPCQYLYLEGIGRDLTRWDRVNLLSSSPARSPCQGMLIARRGRSRCERGGSIPRRRRLLGLSRLAAASSPAYARGRGI